jgi:hypothetical protein
MTESLGLSEPGDDGVAEPAAQGRSEPGSGNDGTAGPVGARRRRGCQPVPGRLAPGNDGAAGQVGALQ